MEYRATRNFVLGEGEKGDHKHIKKGEVFECSEEFAETHLAPHGLCEGVDEADEREAAADEKEAEELEAKAAEKKKTAAEKKAKVGGRKKKSDKAE